MKPSVIREMTTEEVQDRLSAESEALVKLKLSHAVSPIENPKLLNAKRKDIARLETELKNREMQEQEQQNQ